MSIKLVFNFYAKLKIILKILIKIIIKQFSKYMQKDKYHPSLNRKKYNNEI